MMKCPDCGSKIETRLLDEFCVSDLLGAPFPVYLAKAVTEHYCISCGKVTGHSIPSPDELNAIVALLRAHNPIKLSGSEIRFLRTTLAWKANRLASELRIKPEVLSRYENDKVPIGEVYEQLLRAIVFIWHKDSAPAIDLDISTFLNMKVVSCRDADNSVVIRLIRVSKTEKQASNTHVKWRRNKAA